MKDKALHKYKNDLLANRYGRARDRLHGMISRRPNQIDLRFELGKVYFHLGDPIMAGCYWYLHEPSNKEMHTCRTQFEQAHGRNSQQIARAIKFKGDASALSSAFARQILDELEASCANRRDELDLSEAQKIRPVKSERMSHVLDRLSLFATAILLVVSIILIPAIIAVLLELIVPGLLTP